MLRLDAREKQGFTDAAKTAGAGGSFAVSRCASSYRCCSRRRKSGLINNGSGELTDMRLFCT